MNNTKKSDLKNGMLVETTGGRYGIVVVKDATDKNCIKFLYDPAWLQDHGCLYNTSANIIVSLDDFDEDLNAWVPATEDDAEAFDNVAVGDKLVIWQIIRVIQPSVVWERKNLKPTCGGLMGDNIV